MKERLLHILDGTACLTRRQMKDYLAGTMLPEEIHAAEAHIASCPLCNMALEGFEAHSEEALEAIGSLNSGFLKAHFDAITPQIHLNSLSPAAVISKPKKKTKTTSLLRLTGIAAAALLAVGTFWYLKNNQESKQSGMIAQRDETSLPVPEASRQTPVSGAIADSIMAEPTTSSRANTAALDEPAPVITEAKKTPPKPSLEKAIAQNNPAVSDEQDDRKDAVAAASVPAPANAAPLVAKRMAGKALAEQQSPSLAKTADDKVKKERSEAESIHGEVAANSKMQDVYVAPGNTADRNTNHLQKGDELFGAGKYGAALKSYRAEMSSGDRSRSSQASVMAARCYINLGQKARGIELLQRVVNEGSGSQRRQAKRLLRDLERDN